MPGIAESSDCRARRQEHVAPFAPFAPFAPSASPSKQRQSYRGDAMQRVQSRIEGLLGFVAVVQRAILLRLALVRLASQALSWALARKGSERLV